MALPRAFFFTGHLPFVEALLEKGICTIEHDGESALCAAAEAGQLGMCAYLAPLAKAHSGCEPLSRALHAAAEVADELVCSLLLQHGADANYQDDLGYTPLHTTISACRSGMEARAKVCGVVRLLLRENANICAETDHGETPLHLSALGGLTECVALLLQQTEPNDAAISGPWTAPAPPIRNNELDDPSYSTSLAVQSGEAETVALLLRDRTLSYEALHRPMEIAVNDDRADLLLMLVRAISPDDYSSGCDELGELADHAAENGLLHLLPILLYASGSSEKFWSSDGARWYMSRDCR